MKRAGIEQFYDRHASSHRVWWAGMLDVESELAARYRDFEEKRRLARLLPRRHFPVAVELGCGAGRWMPFLAARCAFSVGVDLSLSLLAQARCPGSLPAVRTALVRGDLTRLPLAGRVDLVYLSSTCLYLDDMELAEVAGWCARSQPVGGILVSRDSVSTGERFDREGDYSATYRPLEEYLRVFTARGYRPVGVARSYLPLSRPLSLAHRLSPRIGDLMVRTRTLRAFDAAVDMMARLGGRPSGRQNGVEIAHLFVVYERCG